MILAASSNPDAARLLLELAASSSAWRSSPASPDASRLSPIPFYLVGGLAFGTGGFADLGAADEFVEVGAEIGVILMLLLLGLEYSAEELVGNLRRSAPAGGVDLVLNFAPGAALGFILGWDPLAAVMLGGVTTSRRRVWWPADPDRVGNRETSTVLTLLVIEDLVMVLYLPIVAGLLFGGSALATDTPMDPRRPCVSARPQWLGHSRRAPLHPGSLTDMS